MPDDKTITVVGCLVGSAKNARCTVWVESWDVGGTPACSAMGQTTQQRSPSGHFFAANACCR
eukprot:477092-Prymnesium_polylepis.1